MRKAFSAPTLATPDDLFAVVSDLGTYPHWLDLVQAAEPGGDPGAWLVTLRASVGPLARSKRLRMVRTVDDGQAVRFERQELDGRDHSTWVLAARVSPLAGDGPERSEVALELRYDGALWSNLLEGVLGSAADRATERLQAYVMA